MKNDESGKRVNEDPNLEPRYSILDPRYSILEPRYSILDPRYSIIPSSILPLNVIYS
jgi:alcohol dehydrogenase YqhD (iron-dependent ADH family)